MYICIFFYILYIINRKGCCERQILLNLRFQHHFLVGRLLHLPNKID